jgi:hypothetical protein
MPRIRYWQDNHRDRKCSSALLPRTVPKELSQYRIRRIGARLSGVFVPLVAISSPDYGSINGQPAVYLYIAALEVNVLNCRRPGVEA